MNVGVMVVTYFKALFWNLLAGTKETYPVPTREGISWLTIRWFDNAVSTTHAIWHRIKCEDDHELWV